MERFPRVATQVRATIRTDTFPEVVTGSFVRGTPYEIVIEAASAELHSIPGPLLMGLERRTRDRWHSALKGLGLGAAGGAVLFGIGVVVQNRDPGLSCALFCSTGHKFALGALVGVAVGAPLGAIVGGLIGSEDWERIW